MHGVNQRERLIPMSVYRKELAKARLGDNIANHMGFIFTAILYDKFDMTFKQVTNFYSKTVERRKAWQDDDNEEVTSDSMREYCQKKKIDVIKWVKSIPMPQKLYMADIQKGRAVLGADRNIESALASTMYLTIPTLKESYRFSNAKIEEFMNWVAYYIDSYWRKQPKSKDHFLTDEIIDFLVDIQDVYILPTIRISTQYEMIDKNFNIQIHFAVFHFRWRWVNGN